MISAGLFVSSCAPAKEPNLQRVKSALLYQIGEKELVQRLSKSIQYPTVSLEDTTEINYEIYDGFIDFLEQNYPLVHAKTELERIGGYSLIYRWEGSQPDLKPALLMGHYDVVPVSEGSDTLWQYNPFGGKVAGGFVWGRGTLDDKSSIMSVMEAAEYLMKQDFTPRRTVYIALHHDEEVGGERGAKRVADHLEKQGIELEFLVDEGLPIAEEIFDNIEVPLAMIGVAEKGSVNIELTYRQEGGHSSMPPRTTVIGTLSRAVNRIEQRPMDAHYRGLIVETIKPLIPYMSYTQRLAFNNTWLFRGVIKRKLSKNAATNAALRTTAAKTIFEAGFKENVLPVDGRVIINFRLHPNDTIEDVERYVRKRIRNNHINLRVLDRARNPSPVSSTRSRPYRMLRQTIRESFDDALVSPALFVAASDSRHFHKLTSNIYRFRPIRAKHEDRPRIHGIDERISVANYLEMVRFQIRLIENGSAVL